MEFGLTQEEVARRVGKNRVTITNMLRLLRLPPEVQQWISEDRLTTGHAKALLSLSDLSSILDAARKIIQGSYSVRQAEMLVSRYGKGGAKDAADEPEAVDPNVKAAIHASGTGPRHQSYDSGKPRKGTNRTALLLSGGNAPLYDGLMKVRF